MSKNATSFGPGNTASLKSGFRSPRFREAARLALLADMRQLVDRALGEGQPADQLARDFLACALADVHQLDAYVNAQGGVITGKGRVLVAMGYRRSRERDALGWMDRLGLSPKARTSILGGAVQVEGLASQLARARLAQAAPVPQPSNGRSIAPGASGGDYRASQA